MTVATSTLTAFDAGSGARPQEPYVGLRPYREGERPLFFGRDEDAARLRNTIFAGPLTVLYAPSGVGKTSLLVTLVVPDIRAQHGLVVFFDHWPDDDPTPCIKAALLAEAAARGTTVTCPDDASLTAVADAVSTAVGAPLVLVLDQFEQFLIKRAGTPDPLREELAALVRSDIDAHVVISLRQEFLAALDAFRERILSLFRSTYHLQHLSAAGARKAIAQPAEIFGGSCESELVETLVRELRSEPSFEGDPAAIHTGGIELPFLQIICQRLWREAEPGDHRHLAYASYEKLGRASGIIREYVNRVVSALPVTERADMATVLDYLAPRSGAKMSYALQDLCERTCLDEGRVRGVLQLLRGHMVVREREIGRTPCYELNHDAFIRVLRPWVDEELLQLRERQLDERRRRMLRERRRRWNRRALAGGIAIGAVLAVGALAADWWSTDVRLAAVARRLSRQPPASESWARQNAEVHREVEAVASYLVAKGNGRGLDRLAALLEKHARLVTRFYTAAPDTGAPGSAYGGGRNTTRRIAGGSIGLSGVAAEAPGRSPGFHEQTSSGALAGTRAPLTLVYGRNMDLGANGGRALQDEWRPVAAELARTIGIPIPLELNLNNDRTESSRALYVEVPGRDTAHVRARLAVIPRDSAIVAVAALPELPRKHFFDGPARRRGWSSLDDRLPGGPLSVVPGWTVPIWRVYGHDVLPRERVVALALAAKILDDPGLVLTKDAMAILLDGARRSSRATVEYALALPNGEERIRAFLIEVVRSRHSIASLPYLLDVLTDHPTDSLPQLAARIGREPWLLGAVTNARIERPRAITRQARMARAERSAPAFWAADYATQRSRFPIHVGLGNELADALLKEAEGALRPALADSLTGLGTELFRGYGLSLPDIRFERDSTLPPRDFRIELLAQSRADSSITQQRASLGDPVGQVVLALRRRVLMTRAYWITVESIDSLLSDENFPSERAAWLRAHFSIVDLKRILRAVVAPTPAELAAYRDTSRGTLPPTPVERTVANPHWVLGSLVFWTAATDLRSVDSAASVLRATQRARLQPTEMLAAHFDDALLEQGVYTLETSETDDAERTFRRAVAADRAGSARAFLHIYRRTALIRQLLRVEHICTLPTPRNANELPRVPEPVLAELADLLSGPALDLEERFSDRLLPDPGSYRPTLGLCLMAGYTAAERYGRAARLFDTLSSQRAIDDWSADNMYRLAYWALMSPDLDTVIDRRARAAALLTRAAQQWPGSTIESTVFSLSNLCSAVHSSPAWCRRMVDSLSDAQSHSFFFPLYAASIRVDADRREEALEALALLDSSAARLSREAARYDDSVRTRMGAWIPWLRAKANLTLAGHGDRARLDGTARDLRALLGALPRREAEGWPKTLDVHSTLVDVYTMQGRADDALALVGSARALRGTYYAPAIRHFLYFTKGEVDSTLQVADSLLQEYPDFPFVLFMAATSQLFAGSPRAEQTARRYLEYTSHEYRDYMRLLLYWSLTKRGSPEAVDLLEERWAEIDTTTWPERLKHRERTVWREMLVGYYLGTLDRERVFGPLVDTEHLSGSELAPLGFSLDAIRCEAYFYDALHQDVTGSPKDRRQRAVAALEKSRATKYALYYEYHWAGLLLDRLRPAGNTIVLSNGLGRR